MEKVIVKEKVDKKTKVSFIKNPKFYIPVSILIGVIVVFMASVLILRPEIARGEYSLGEIMKILSGQEVRIKNLETKTTPTAPSNKSQTTTPTPTTTNNYKAYVPRSCTTTLIKPETEYLDASWIDVGKTFTTEGWDSANVVCIADSNGAGADKTFIPGGTKKIYTGTRKPTVTIPATPTGPTAEEIRAQNLATCMQEARNACSISPGSSLCREAPGYCNVKYGN